MDPVSAIAGAIGAIFSTVGSGQRDRYDRLPDWMTPADFQRRDNTANIILIGMFVVLIVIVIAIAIGRKK